jgi:hypothetical protein
MLGVDARLSAKCSAVDEWMTEQYEEQEEGDRAANKPLLRPLSHITMPRVLLATSVKTAPNLEHSSGENVVELACCDIHRARCSLNLALAGAASLVCHFCSLENAQYPMLYRAPLSCSATAQRIQKTCPPFLRKIVSVLLRILRKLSSRIVSACDFAHAPVRNISTERVENIDSPTILIDIYRGSIAISQLFDAIERYDTIRFLR